MIERGTIPRGTMGEERNCQQWWTEPSSSAKGRVWLLLRYRVWWKLWEGGWQGVFRPILDQCLLVVRGRVSGTTFLTSNHWVSQLRAYTHLPPQPQSRTTKLPGFLEMLNYMHITLLPKRILPHYDGCQVGWPVTHPLWLLVTCHTSFLIRKNCHTDQSLVVQPLQQVHRGFVLGLI